MVYSQLIFVCVDTDSRRLNQRFSIGVFIAYLYTIFVCANCASFSPQRTIFNSARITYFLYAYDTDQRFLAEHSRFIFV